MWKKIKSKVKATERYKRNEWLLKVIYWAVTIVINIAIFTWLGERIEDFQVFWVNPEYRGYTYQLLGAIAVGIIGFGLYLVRVRWREQYGLIEIGFALATAFFTFGRLFNPSPDRAFEFPINLLAVAAAVYLVVRGIDNVEEGSSEKRKIWVQEEVERIKAQGLLD